jgi:hypothetical protein
MRIGIDGKVIASLAGGIGTSAFNVVQFCVREAAQHYPQLEFVIFTGPHTRLDGIQGTNWRIDERFRHIESSLLRQLYYIPKGLRAQGIDVFHGFDHIGVPLFAKGRTIRRYDPRHHPADPASMGDTQTSPGGDGRLSPAGPTGRLGDQPLRSH